MSQGHLLDVFPAHPRLQVRRRVDEGVQQEVSSDGRLLPASLVDAAGVCAKFGDETQRTRAWPKTDVVSATPALVHHRFEQEELGD